MTDEGRSRTPAPTADGAVVSRPGLAPDEIAVVVLVQAVRNACHSGVVPAHVEAIVRHVLTEEFS